MTNKFYTTKEAAEMAGVPERRIKYARQKKWIENVKELEPKIRFTKAEIENYKKIVQERKDRKRTLDFDLTQNYKFLPTTPRAPKFYGNPTKFQGGIIVAVGDGGTIVNCNTMRQLKPYQTGNGHLQLTLRNGYQPTVETMVGLLHCDNAKYKQIFHHINGVKTDNRASNLLAVTDEEHKKAHRLLKLIKNAQTPNEIDSAKREYQKFIETVQADNKETQKEDLRIIDDLDYPGQAYMFVTEKSYQKYLKSGNESDLVIRAEIFKYE